MQNSLRYPIRVQKRRGETVPVRWKRHDAAETWPIENKSGPGQASDSFSRLAKILFEKSLDAHVRWTELVTKHLVLLVVVSEQRTCNFKRMLVRGSFTCGLTKSGQLQVDIAK